jgi:hypothetical protein
MMFLPEHGIAMLRVGLQHATSTSAKYAGKVAGRRLGKQPAIRAMID